MTKGDVSDLRLQREGAIASPLSDYFPVAFPNPQMGATILVRPGPFFGSFSKLVE